MISKINHLLPLISLNGHLEQSWKCIRKIIYRDILKAQTTPLESAITLGIGYYNLIIRPTMKMIEREHNFLKNEDHLESLKSTAKKAIIHWKNLETKLPDDVEKQINQMIDGQNWYSVKDVDHLLYNNIGVRLCINSEDKNLNLKDLKALKYPNFLYLLSNASTHEIIDTTSQYLKNGNNTNTNQKRDRVLKLIEKICIGERLAKYIMEENIFIEKANLKEDIIEEMTILELKLTQKIKEEKNEVKKEIYEIIDDTELKIIDKNKNKLKANEFLLREGKLIDKQTKVRKTREAMNKYQTSIFDLGIELIEDLEYEIKQKIKTKPGRPRKENKKKEINYNKKID